MTSLRSLIHTKELSIYLITKLFSVSYELIFISKVQTF